MKRKQPRIFSKFLISFLISFWQFQVLGQNNEIHYAANLRPRLLSITFSSGLCQKAGLRKLDGEYEISSTPKPFWELGITVQSDLNDNFYFVTGLKGSITARNAIFSAPINEINPNAYPEPFPPLKINDADFSATIPLLLEKDWQFKNGKLVFGRVGLNLKYSFGYDEDDYDNYLYDTSNQRINVFSLDLNSNNHNKPWLTYHVGGGYGWNLRNHNILKAEIVANLSLTKFVNGTYQINIPGHPSSDGKYGVKGSYLGVSLTYIFCEVQKNKMKEILNTVHHPTQQ